MASCGIGGPGFGERLRNLEKELEGYRSCFETEDKWKEILGGWILHNFSNNIQREILQRRAVHGERNVPINFFKKIIMSAIEYNAVNVGNSNNHHQHQHNHGVAAAMLAGNPAANLLCNYCPPAAKRKKPNNVGETIHMVDARQLQQRTVQGLGGTVPISLTPVTNALIRQDTRFNAEEFDPVKIFGELSTAGLATTSSGVIGTTEGGFGATLLAGFNATAGTSNLLDHTRILSFAADGNRMDESLESKRNAVAGTKTFPGIVTAVQVPNNRGDGQQSQAAPKKTGKGKKSSKGSKSAASHNSSEKSSSNSSSSSPRRKLKSMSIEEKFYVLQRLLKPDVSQATICEEMQLNKSVVSRIWCDRFKIEELYKQGSGNRIKVKYMHNGPAHPKKRGHGKKAKAMAKQGSSSNNSKSNNASSDNTASNHTTTSATVVTNTPTTSAYHQTLQQPTFARPSLLGLYTTESLNNLNVAARYNDNVQH